MDSNEIQVTKKPRRICCRGFFDLHAKMVRVLRSPCYKPNVNLM